MANKDKSKMEQAKGPYKAVCDEMDHYFDGVLTKLYDVVLDTPQGLLAVFESFSHREEEAKAIADALNEACRNGGSSPQQAPVVPTDEELYKEAMDSVTEEDLDRMERRMQAEQAPVASGEPVAALTPEQAYKCWGDAEYQWPSLPTPRPQWGDYFLQVLRDNAIPLYRHAPPSTALIHEADIMRRELHRLACEHQDENAHVAVVNYDNERAAPPSGQGMTGTCYLCGSVRTKHDESGDSGPGADYEKGGGEQ